MTSDDSSQKQTQEHSHKQDFQYSYPLPIYYLTRFFDKINGLVKLADKFETLLLRPKLSEVRIDRPIYITGLARAGTTITLEMLSNHPDVGNHKYIHIPMTYLPFLWQSFALKVNVFTERAERIHQDGIIVNRDSPEALEEVFWQRRFSNVMDESKSNIMDGLIDDDEFLRFYKTHIKKLLFAQHKTRYLTKNNYNVTRIEYIKRVIPDARFLIIVRNPINHLASTIKQSKLFKKMSKNNERLEVLTQIIGHREFGPNRVCINVDNTPTINYIRELWKNDPNDVEAWAIYWNSIYEYVKNVLETNEKVASSTLVVNYEDLCDNSEEIIDKIIDHTGLSKRRFRKVKKIYAKKLRKPKYYKPEFGDEDIQTIKSITGDTASYYGYFN